MALRLQRAVPFAVIGSVGIIGGGIAAAVTGPTDWKRGSWVAAFLVLVVGVGQIVLGAGQAALARFAPTPRIVATECVLYNVSAALVIIGTLIHRPVVVAIGSVVLLGALAMFAFAAPISTRRNRLAATAYRLILAVLLISTPIGVVLSLTRS